MQIKITAIVGICNRNTTTYGRHNGATYTKLGKNWLIGFNVNYAKHT